MRLLVCPVYEAGHFGADSSWLLSRDWVRLAAERGWFSYYVTPSATADGLTDRVERLLPTPKIGRQAEALIPTSVWERWREPLAYPIDAVLTNNPVQGLVLSRFLEGVNKAMYEVPVVIWNVSAKFFDSDEVTPLSRDDLATWALGYALNVNVMPSRFSLERARDVVAALCGAPLIADYDRRTTVLPIGPDCDLLDRLRGPKFDRFSFYFGGRFTATKGGEKAVGHYVQYVAGGREADVYVTYVDTGRRLHDVVKRMGAQGVVRAMSDLSWEDALSLMSRCHASIYWQSLKLFPAACFEQLYAGLVVLVRWTGNEEEFLPDYPFYFRNDVECAAMLRWVAENYEEAKRRIAHVPALIRERYDRTTNIGALLDIVEARVADRKERARERAARDLEATEDLVENALRGVGTPCSYRDLGRALVHMRPNLLRQGLNSRGQMLACLTQNMLPAGFVDNCLQPEPSYMEAEHESA